jgi:hypothetical protein
MDPQRQRTDKRTLQPAVFFQQEQEFNSGEAYMGMVMVKCLQTGRAIPTGIKAEVENFLRSPVFFGRTHCPICHTDHSWFSREAWVDEHSARASHRSGGSLA